LTEFTFVMNPMAAKGAAKKIDTIVERLLPGFGSTYEIVRTERPGHATEIAREAQSRVVVAVGGDGTINEVVNGLVATGKVLGIIPAGSGNDFIKSAGIPKDILKSIGILRSAKARQIDLGTVACGTQQAGSMNYAPKRYFVNGVGIGFDGQVAWRVSQSKHLRGTLAYFVAVLKTLNNYDSPEFSIALDDVVSKGRKLLLATGNGKCAGGGFYLTPEAAIDDGWLDTCAIEDVPVRRILRLIPAVMSGKPLSHPAVSYARAKKIRVESPQKFYVHADGEVVGHNVSGVVMEVVPRGVDLLAP
jgi:diacylglycerol kinase (ATP)